MDSYNFSSGFHGVFSDLYMNYSHNNIFMVNSSHVYKQNINEDFEPLYDVPIFLVVLLSIFYGTISVLAVVGNALVMWIVATSRRMQNVTNCFIANLALADIVIGLFAIPFQFQAALLQRWSLPEFMCAFCPFVQVLTVTVSVFTLTAIAVDRHKAILDPLSARPSKLTAKLIIGGIWAAGGALAAPMAVALRVQIVEESDLANPEIIHRKPFCQNVYLSDSSMLSYRIVLFFLQYLTPLCVISFVYARVALKLWGSRAPGNAQYSRDANLMKNKKKVIKMLFIVVALFAICWLPLQTYNVLQDTFPKINQYRYINIIFFCCDWLAMSNSCYNPFIYGIYNEKFKREFKLRFPGGKKWNQTPTNDSYDMDKTQTLRFSNSFRSHGDWRRSHSAVQFPMVSYSVHFCPHPYESKRTRFLRTTHFNSETSESSYHAKSKLKNVHYSIDNQNGMNNMTNKGDKLKMGNSTRFCKNHLQDPKANNAFDSSEDERSLCESKKKSENSGCFRKKKYVNKMDEPPRNEMCSKDVLINKRPKTNDTTAYLDGKDNKKKSMEFSASFVNSDSSHSSAGGPYYRGVIVRKPTQMRCFNQTKWDVGLDGENVETEIYIFPEGERNAHGSSDEAISGRVSDELCL